MAPGQLGEPLAHRRKAALSRRAPRRPPPPPLAVAAVGRELGGPGCAAGLEAQARGEADGSCQIPPRVWAWVVLAEVMVALRFVTSFPKPPPGPLPLGLEGQTS